jgi:hypothetical protein
MTSSGGAQAFIESAQPGVTPGQARLSAIPVTVEMGALGSRGLHGAGTEEAPVAGNDGSAFPDTSDAEKLLRVTDRYGSYPPRASTASKARPAFRTRRRLRSF